MDLSIRQKWLLAIINSTPHVQGDTRLQKYILFSDRQILDGQLYDDWKAWKFGGFSTKLAGDMDALKKEEYVKAHQITVFQGGPVFRYVLSSKAKTELEFFEAENKELLEKIRDITIHYFRKRLDDVLADSYRMYPDLTNESTIKAEVLKKQIEKDSILAFGYELPFDKIKTDLDSIPTSQEIPIEEHLFNDNDLRDKLAKLAGLEKTPSLDPNSFDKMAGVLHDKIKATKIDSVELVRSVRGS